uniref:Dual specificity protein phosphatase 12 n=1 Tax=Phascolarctos cinereus TaxID=38626 RepID=A0A6P5KIJ5_PHACI|nr:dual specificity protein phosphatase 12 isoform X2 [Phascolarctos cinereus]
MFVEHNGNESARIGRQSERSDESSQPTAPRLLPAGSATLAKLPAARLDGKAVLRLDHWAPPCWKPRATAASRAMAAPELLEVRPGLYLGGAAATERSRLREAGVTAVLTVDTEEPRGDDEGLQTLFISARDEPETDLLSQLDRCIAFIGRARADGVAVLVHCHAGISRSVAVMTAYLMKTEQLPFEDAYGNLQTVKPEAKMNEGFEWQLKLYQAMGCEVDTSSAIYKQFRLQKVTEKYPELQNLPREVFAVDPTLISQELKNEILYKCRKCRRSLFRSSSILDHNEGSGPAAFAHKKMTPLIINTGNEAKCTSYFIEPVQWMESALLGVMDGQILG